MYWIRETISGPQKTKEELGIAYFKFFHTVSYHFIIRYFLTRRSLRYIWHLYKTCDLHNTHVLGTILCSEARYTHHRQDYSMYTELRFHDPMVYIPISHVPRFPTIILCSPFCSSYNASTSLPSSIDLLKAPGIRRSCSIRILFEKPWELLGIYFACNAVFLVRCRDENLRAQPCVVIIFQLVSRWQEFLAFPYEYRVASEKEN